jgi:hypothetical protein
MKKTMITVAALASLALALLTPGCSWMFKDQEDRQAPVLSTGELADNGDTLSITFSSNEGGFYWYWVVRARPSRPTASEVLKEGIRGKNDLHMQENGFTLTKEDGFPPEDYRVYIAASDRSGNLSAVLVIVPGAEE